LLRDGLFGSSKEISPHWMQGTTELFLILLAGVETPAVKKLQPFK
jgi:hypothetical protein